MIRELCKGVHCVDLGESFPTHIFLQNFASIQPRTSPVKFARSSRRESCEDALVAAAVAERVVASEPASPPAAGRAEPMGLEASEDLEASLNAECEAMQSVRYASAIKSSSSNIGASD